MTSSVPDSMDCPQCGHVMQQGRVEVSGMIRRYIPRADTSDLWWYSRTPSRNDREMLIEDGTARLAFGCAECAVVTLFTTPELGASYGRPVGDDE